MDSNSISRASSACVWLVSLFAILAPGATLAAFFDPFYESTFGSPETIADWTVTSGNWQIVNAEFRAATAPVSIATIHAYAPAQFGHDTIGANFSLDVYAWIGTSAANARVGAVFDFADAGNFHEVTVSATGTAELRSRIGGVSRTLASASVDAPGANKWIHITLVRSSGQTTLRIDGVLVFDNVSQRGLQSGEAGLIARNTNGRFDDLDVRGFGRQDPYREDFNDGAANGWNSLSGTWSAASKVYTSTAVVPTAITQGPLRRLWDVERATADLVYTLKVRMLNPYGGSGNLVGIAWVRDAANYTEAVFSPTGEARLNEIVNGVRSTIASAQYLGGERNTWFEVEVGNDAGTPHQATHIKVNGVPVFDVAPNIRDGELSLITHWSPARFDNVRAAFRFFSLFSEDFNDGNAQTFVPTGTWRVQDSMFSSTAVVKASRAFVRESAGWHELADIEFRARMLNRFGGSGNLVGFTYGARGSVYHEAVFSPTGDAHLRKVVKDVAIPIATAPYEGGRLGQWFDAQLIRQGERTTVKVNGVTVFDNILQPDAIGGGLGFVAHWTSASVDDVSFTQIPVTRYRSTALPDLASSRRSSQVRAINDRGEAVGWSRTAVTRVDAVLWRGGRVINLGARFGDSSAGNDINNNSEIVGGYFGLTAFSWKDGQLQDVVFPECDRSEALGINEGGQIVGVCGAGGDGTSAVLREPDARVITLEQLPGGLDWSDAYAINDRGEIVGDSAGARSTFLDAVSWQGGAVEPLGSEGSALDINNRGQIVGILRTGEQQQAVTWKDRELIFLPLRVGEFHAQALGINEHGVIVGSTSASPPEDRNLQAAPTLWHEGRVTDLSKLLVCEPLPEATALVSAIDINERGEIAVNGFDFSIGESKAFVLVPVLGEESCDR